MTSETLEASLERVLDISNAFGAVLLLDEADVFLEQRTPRDLQRNALVSIFLRLLEYYKGILFLTTNRIKTFDDAFHSRIHITLGYSNHDLASREQIWRNFGTHMVEGMNIKDEDYIELATWELNGRQVKNVLSACKALATDRGEKITMNDLRTVLHISLISSSQKPGVRKA
jgi:AAA+ superfamily predicted ATPase